MSDQALSGVRVLDLTERIAGPFCARLLADYGADVIKVERPGVGDPARSMGPFFHDDPHPDRSGLFLHLNRNKRSITLDVTSAAGKRIFLSLVREADIVLESFEPRVLPSLGLGYSTLREINPRLVMTSISNFGQTGPYRDMKAEEIVLYAMGGPMHATGLPEREPTKLGGNVCQYHAGSAAAAATAIALWGAESTGKGEHLDIALFRVQAASIDRRSTMLITYAYTGEITTRRVPGAVPAMGMRPVADGYISMNADAARFPLVLDLIGRPDLAKDPRFSDPTARSQPGRGDEFDEYLLPFLLQHTKRQAFRLCQENHIPSGPVYTMADVLAEEQFRDRGYWTTIDHPTTGPVEYPGPPFRMSCAPKPLSRPAPRLGEHNREVLCGVLGFSLAELSALRQAGVI